MQAFVARNRKPKFQLTLKILDLNNVPLVSGSSYIKWNLPHSTSAEHRGRTGKFPIRDHCVTYEYSKTLPVRLSVDKSNMLQESFIVFEVAQEYSGGAGRGERILLGNVRINLAEYVEPGAGGGEDGSAHGAEGAKEEEEEGVVRRYLMQNSKINSTLKIGIHMKLIEGERNFIAPALKTAPVFGGIAGIMTGESADSEDAGHLPSLSTHSRENAEGQDLYRRNLAAFLHAQPGELPADECIEDIFSGGTGWGSAGPPSTGDDDSSHPRKRDWSRARDRARRDRSRMAMTPLEKESDSDSADDSGDGPSARPQDHKRNGSLAASGSGTPPQTRHASLKRPPLQPSSSGRDDEIVSQYGGRSSLEHSARRLHAESSDMFARSHGAQSASQSQRGQARAVKKGKESEREVGGAGQADPSRMEVDEFEMRSHLRSWVLPGEGASAAAR